MENSKEEILYTKMPIEKVSEQILYLPVTNGKAEQSIKYGVNLIQSYVNQQTSHLQTQVKELSGIIDSQKETFDLLSKKAEERIAELEEALALDDRWIRVEDALPETELTLVKGIVQVLCLLEHGEQMVLAFVKHDFNPGKFYMDYKKHFDDYTNIVIAWQPLPHLPSPPNTESK